ncbi:MAG: VapE domain-containing protein [Pseudomonadota bacterium]
MTDSLKITTATAFMEYMFPEGDWTITIIREGIGPRTHVFLRDAKPGTGRHTSDLQALIDQNQDANIYYQPNRLIRRMGPGDKAGEVDVAFLDHLQVDIDPLAGEDLAKEQDAILARLFDERPKAVPQPSVLVFSGGGFQAFWKLSEPRKVDGDVGLISDLKRYSRWLSDRLDGDSCFNPAHLMRLPFTMNNPSQKKLEKNPERKACRSAVINDASSFKSYDLSDFKQSQGKSNAKLNAERMEVGAPIAPKIEDLMLIDGPSDLLPAIVCGKNGKPPGRDDVEPAFDPERWASRSEQQFYVSCQLIRAGMSNEEHLGVLLNPEWGVSESVLDKKHQAHRYAIRQIESAAAHVAQSDKADRDANGDLKGKLKWRLNEDESRKKCLHNYKVAVQELGVSIRKDTFNDCVMIGGMGRFDGPLTDAAVTRMRLMIEDKFSFQIGKDPMYDIVGDYAEDHRFHPVADYLDGLEWDGKGRLDTWMTRYMGVDQNDYTKAIGALVMVAAVQRIRRPGCKFDEMVVLEGDQGTGKSSALRALAVNADWFADELPLGGDGKQVMEAIGGKWIIEAAELAGMGKRSSEQLKAMLSRSFDKGRAAYGRISEQRDRQCVFFATHNPDKGANQYLMDQTGNRRFWPVECGKIDLEGLKRDRDQLWAEAAFREARGDSIRLDPSLYHLAAGEQAKRKTENPMEAKFEALMLGKSGRIPIGMMYEPLGVNTANHQQVTMMGRAAKALGWERKKLSVEGCRVMCYVKGDGIHGQIELEPFRGKDGQWRIIQKEAHYRDMIPDNHRELI